MSAHPIQWQGPQPLWGRFGATPAAAATAEDQQRPAILRFATDDFMDQMLATLARDPSRIDRLVARPESWRSPMSSSPDLVERTPVPVVAKAARRSLFSRKPKAPVVATSQESNDPASRVSGKKLQLKLFQPAHQRFYLVASSLVCGIPGMPERAVVSSQGELVNFVIRRMLPAVAGQSADLHEFAYVKDAQGARWQRVSQDADDAKAVFGEELLPVFPLAFTDDTNRSRTLWGGFVPVGRREEYMTAKPDRSAPTSYADAQRQALDIMEPVVATSKLARISQFQLDVAEPWKNLIRSSIKLASSLGQNVTIGGDQEPTDSNSTKPARVLEFNLGQQHASWLILLDFADYLETYLKDVWDAIQSGGAGAANLPEKRKALYDWLGTASMESDLVKAMNWSGAWPAKASLREALKAVRVDGVRDQLEATTLTYTSASSSADWPNFYFVLAGVDCPNLLTKIYRAAGPYSALASLDPSPIADFDPEKALSPDMAPEANNVDFLTLLVGRALEGTQETDAPPVPFALQMVNAIKGDIGDSGWFVIRYVHQRRDCGPLHAPTLSAPTQRFQLASFFDPDAPARPIRISLPRDTTPAGLRKHNKNTAFILSDILCGQVQRAKGLGFIDLVLSVLPWPLHKDLNVGSGGPCQDNGEAIGMICSLSIPIITICALIILIIMITLLDLIFRWMPFFIMCFPVPKFKGKS